MADYEARASAAYVDEDYVKARDLFTQALAAGASNKGELLSRRAAWCV